VTTEGTPEGTADGTQERTEGGIGYADGAESSVLSALRSATDVSAGSAELAATATTLEMAYHFAPQRLGLLAPLRLRPGIRALDIGCGTGVLSRALGEAGAEVLGLEGTEERAAAARERCRDLPGVRIVQGAIGERLAEVGEHDLALMCGVLEYSQQFEDGPLAVLRSVVDTLSAQGVLVLAIENQLGLKYLLGGTEDHHGKSWIGLADYPGDQRTPRTWTRAALSDLLDEAGLTAQRWLMPYPDYKLPKVLLDERVFDRPDAEELVDKLVRDPLSGTFGGNDGAVQGRDVHRLAVAEGVGASVASSFLVLAAFTDSALADIAAPDLGWLVSGARRPEWRRTRAVDDGLVLRTVADGSRYPAHGAHPWLRQSLTDAEDLVPGVPLDRLLLDALRVGDEQRLVDLVGQWRTACLAQAREPRDGDARHPYLPGRAGVAVLPADHLDIHPGNFIRSPDDGLVRIDREWSAGDGVDAELALLRGLLEFAQEIVTNHSPHPWSPGASLHEVLAGLAAPAGLGDALARRWDELVDAEARLQDAVSAVPVERTTTALRTDYDRSRPAPLWQVPGGLTALREDRALRPKLEQDLHEARDWFADRERDLTGELDQQHTHIADLTDRLADGARDADLLHHEADLAKSHVAELDDRIGLAFAEVASAVDEARTAWETNAATDAALAGARAQVAELAERLRRTSARLDALNRSKPVRLARRTLWPAGRLLRGTRDLALNRPGGEPDGVLRRAGSLASVLATRYRDAARGGREDHLYFDLPVPEEPVAVGSGQVVELSGWVVHADLPVRAVTVLAGERRYPASTGHHRLDVALSMRRGGVAVPTGSGIQVRVPLAAVTEAGEVPLALLVELTDGTELTRALPPLVVRPGAGTTPVEVTWPGDGPKVAVCLATYRPDAGHLAAQLDSLRAQTHRNWVCVISDDGSPQESMATVRSLIDGDDRFVLVANEENVGFYRNFERVLGLVPADADAVALCDQDDVWDADKLTTLLGRLADPAVTLAYGDMRLVDAEGGPLAPSFWDQRVNQWHDLTGLLMLNTVTGAASLARADLVRELVLPFPPGSPTAFHDQWIAVCALAGGRVEFVDRPLQSYRQHAGNVTGHHQERLDANLPGPLGWLGLGLGVDRLISEHQRAELGAVTEYELRRVAQFATVLLLRAADRLAPDTRAELVGLATSDRQLGALVRQVAARLRDRPETAGAERRLLAAALRSASRRRRERRPVRRLAPPDVG
jgi:O-antigen biosynthesis protein